MRTQRVPAALAIQLLLGSVSGCATERTRSTASFEEAPKNSETKQAGPVVWFWAPHPSARLPGVEAAREALAKARRACETPAGPENPAERQISTEALRYALGRNAQELQGHETAYVALTVPFSVEEALLEALCDPPPWLVDVKSSPVRLAPIGTRPPSAQLGGRVLIFYVGLVTFAAEGEAEVECGYYAGNLSGARSRLKLRSGPDGWSVTEEKTLWTATLESPHRPSAGGSISPRGSPAPVRDPRVAGARRR